jgi:hypothetical protein
VKRAVLLSASLLLCSSLPAAGQQAGSGASPEGAALRRAFLRLPPPSFGELATEEPLVREQTISLRPPDADEGRKRTPAEAWLQGLGTIYDTAVNQRWRFDQTAQPMYFERSGLYFRRDLYSTTKGLVLYHAWQDRFDIGLYKRRLEGASTQVSGSAEQYGWCGPSNKSFVFSGGRQVYVGLRFNLNKIFY